jgi:DNA replication protein DnaC
MIERPKQSTFPDQSSRQTENAEVCNECFGTGTKLIEGKGAVLCPCKRSDPKRKLTVAARIPERYSDCSFDTFETKQNTKIDAALLYARSLVDDYPAVDRGLLLMGSVGVGKTHLAVSIIRGLIARGFACIFSESGSLLKEIQDSYNPISKSSELRVLAPIYEADVLVLDELGATVPTDWVRDTIYQIINKRYNDNKLTIFTTNYLDKPRVENQDTSTSARTFSRKANTDRIREMTTLEDRIGIRLRSRLYEMCTTVLMDGEDYRTHMGRGRFDLASS